MGRITSGMPTEQIINSLSDGLPGAMTVLLMLLEHYGMEALVFYSLLDLHGFYGEDIWNSYKRSYGANISAFAEALRQGEPKRYERPPGITEIEYGSGDPHDVGFDVDEEFQSRNPYELYWFRQVIPGELASAGYADYDGLILVVAVKDGLRVRVPVLDEDHGTRKALEILEAFE